jgi:hypothetical protein
MDPKSQTTASQGSESPAMIEKLTLVTIVVKNQEAASTFTRRR